MFKIVNEKELSLETKVFCIQAPDFNYEATLVVIFLMGKEATAPKCWTLSEAATFP